MSDRAGDRSAAGSRTDGGISAWQRLVRSPMALGLAVLCLILPLELDDRYHVQAEDELAASSDGELVRRPPHDVALVLDVSRSMGGTGLEAMQAAVPQLLASVFEGADARDGLRVALIPFSARVNAGAWLADTGWARRPPALNCVEEPGDDPIATTLAPRQLHWSPSLDLPLRGWQQRGDRWIYGEARTDAPCPSPLLPLQASRTAVVAKLSELEAAGTSRPDLALHWGWRVLSPAWQGQPDPPVRKAAEEPSDRNYTPRRSIVLVTDGEVSPSYSPLTLEAARRQFDEACVAARNEGITVFVVALAAPATKMLRTCATSANHFVEVRTLGGLDAAMRYVGTALAGSGSSMLLPKANRSQVASGQQSYLEMGAEGRLISVLGAFLEMR